MKRQAMMGRKFLLTTYLTKDFYLEYIKNSQDSTMKNNLICSLGKQFAHFNLQIKNPMRYHYTTVRMTTIFKTVKIPNSAQHMKKLIFHTLPVGIYSHSEK